MATDPSTTKARTGNWLPGKRVRRGGLAVLDQALVGGTNFLTTVAVGRWCGADELGVLALGLTIVYLAVATHESLITMPYTIYGPRLSGRAKAFYRGSTLLATLGLGLLAALLLSACASLLDAGRFADGFAPVLWMLVIVVPSWLLREVARRFAFADLAVRSALAVSAMVATLQLAALAALATRGELTAVSAMGAIAVANAVAGIFWLIFARKSLRFSRQNVVQSLRGNWKLGRWMFAGQAVTTMSAHSLPWIIAAALGTHATGAFAACEALVRLANPVIVALTNLLTPQVARAFAERGVAGVRRVVNAAMLTVAVFMALFLAGIFVAGSWLLDALFGGAYAAYWPTLLVLAAAQGAMFLSLGPSRGLMVFERTDACLRADVADFVVRLALTVLLVEAFGALGAAWGAAAGNSVLTILMIGSYWAVARRIQQRERRQRQETADETPHSEHSGFDSSVAAPDPEAAPVASTSSHAEVT